MSEGIIRFGSELAHRSAWPEQIRGPRIVVYGNTVEGVYDLVDQLRGTVDAWTDCPIEPVRAVEAINDTFFGKTDEEPEVVSPPSLVIMLPTMREYDPHPGDIPTPYDHIVDLCERFGVPYAYASRSLGESPSLTAGPPQLPEA